MKRFLLFWTILSIILVAPAQERNASNSNSGANDYSQIARETHVTPTQALNVGYTFMRTGNNTRGNSVSKQTMQLIYTGRAIDSLTLATTDCYYVFSLQPKGFVIVAADDRVEPILGYSYDNNFVVENMPDHVRGWLGGYEKQIEAVVKQDIAPEAETTTKWSRLKSGQAVSTRNRNTVGPLLTTTWNQGCYYNNMCPVDSLGPCGHAYAGCVAAAMAQIMRYWQYPSQGIGSHSYDCNYSGTFGSYGTLTADFGSATYNYDNMPNSIGYYSSTSQINEVAQLLYHCGVSVNMMYGPSGSGSALFLATSALNNYFGYSGCHTDYKSAYTDSEWINKLKSSLDNMQPLIYVGDGVGSHAFVCDGYDNENYFHFNWGWGGTWNNYFLLSSLTPGTHDFSSNQEAIFGIDANVPFIRTDRQVVSFLVEKGSESEGEPVFFWSNALSSPLTATVTGCFQISVDSVNYGNTITLGNNRGTMYVRFAPTESILVEHGYLYLTAGSIVDTVILTGGAYTISCAPPENLMVSSQDLQHITIQWDSAAPDHYQQIISLGVDDLDGRVSTSNYDSYTFLNRYCDTDLVAYHGKSLISIDFYFISGATSYSAVVYKGGLRDGTTFDPGVQVLSQTIDIGTLTADSWNTVTLNTPIEIDAAQELWFGICVEAPSNSWVIPLSSCYAPGKGNVIRRVISGSSYWGTNGNGIYSFCLKGTVADRHPLTNYEVFRNGTSIGTTNALAIQDSVDEHNTVSYTVVANWSNGCSASLQRYFSNIAHIHTEPEALDFYTRYGFDNKVKSMTVVGNGLASSINVTVSGHFLISTDSLQFSSNALLDMQGGVLYVKYIPDSANAPFETGAIHFQSGSVEAEIPLSGQCYDACLPPDNLTISQIDTNTVSLNWNAPELFDPGQYELTWCLETRASYGYRSDMKMYMMQRYETTDLSDYHNKLLKAISFIPNGQATVYRLLVYKGGGYDGSSYNPGFLLLEQNVDLSTLTGSQWNTVVLNNPITIDAHEELWFGVYMEAPGGTYPISVGIPYVPHKGCLTKYLAPYSSDWVEFSSSRNYALKAIVEDAPRTCTHYQIDRNEEWINTTTDTHYSDYLSSEGLYHYTVWSVWDNGCKSSSRGPILVSGLCTQAGVSTSVTVCDSYQWHGTTYYNSGTYYYTSIDNRVDTLNLTINSAYNEELHVSACNSYGWCGVTYSQSGDYARTFTAANECDSIVVLHLTITQPTYGDTTVTACDSFTWHGNTYTSSGSYQSHLTNVSGCDSIVTLHLTINHPVAELVEATACESYTWNDSVHTQSGDYTRTFTAANSCDSVVTLHLTVNHPTYSDTTVIACDSFTWHDSTYTYSGSYQSYLTNVSGCDSIVTLYLTINHPVAELVEATACDSYTWNDSIYTQSGDYARTFTAANGCDSVVTLHLTVNHPTYSDTTVVACDSYIWYDSTYTSSGTYQSYLTNAAGCDSIVTLYLIINHPEAEHVEATSCDSYTWNDSIYTQSGDYTQTFTAANSCDSVVTLHLTINYPTYGDTTVVACDSYTWHDSTYTSSGTYQSYLTNAAGCDSNVTLYLTINHPVVEHVEATACENFTWNGTAYTESGEYPITLTSSNGCDSVVTLHLTLFENEASEFTITTNDPCYTWNNVEYCESGDYTQSLETVHGCDSVVTLHLTVGVGIDDYDGANFKVYPNPTSNIVNVEFGMDNGELGEVEIQLYNVYGKLLGVVPVETMCTSSLHRTQIDLSHLTNGVYIIKLVSDRNGRILGTQKIVKQ